MYGVIVNCIAIVVGTFIGIVCRRFISTHISNEVAKGIGVCTLIVGAQMAMNFNNIVIVVVSIALGGAIGLGLNLDQKILGLVQRLQYKVSSNTDSPFAKAFTMSSVLYCSGAMAIVGSIEAGISANYDVLLAKAALDGTISVTFGALYGIGIAFSSISILLYQGGIVLLSTTIPHLQNPDVVKDLAGVGGVLVTMIGLNMIKVTEFKLENYLPSIPVCFILTLFP